MPRTKAVANTKELLYKQPNDDDDDDRQHTTAHYTQ